MNARLLVAPVAVCVLFAACYQGKSDVPRMSSYGTTSGSGGGSGGSGPRSTSGTTSGSTTSGGTGGMAADPCATAIFCDDFESYTAGSPPGGKWDNNQTNGSVAVDTGKARSGKNAVKISADAATDYRSVMISLSDPSLLPASGNDLYGRMMFFLESAPTGTVHWTFIDGSGPVAGKGYDSIYRYGGQLPITSNGNFVGSQLMANYETPDSYQTPPVGPGSDCWLHSDMVVVPVGKWSCAEWQFDGPNNTMRFWLDGMPVDSLTMSGTGQGCVNQAATFPWDAPTFQQIDLGFESYQMDDARVLWIDDVALSTQRVGCP